MATPNGQPNRSVIDDLLAHPGAYTFYQAVRLLERFANATPVGFQGPARQEALRFRALDSLAFPVSEIDEISRIKKPWDDSTEDFLITANFMGLYGPSSPLPAFYTERIIQSGDLGDDESRDRLRAFLDIFHHRIFSLFYRALYKCRYHLVFKKDGSDTFSHYMRCLIGRGTKGMPDERPVLAVRMIRYAGLLTQRPKSAEGLRGILADYFSGLGVRVKQCVGRWVKVEDNNSLGAQFSRLGADLIVGSRVFDRTGRFLVSIGPMGLKEFMRFIPGKPWMEELKDLIKLYLVDELEFSVEVQLRGDEVPTVQLGSETAPALLGWTSWSASRSREDRSVVFSVC